MNRELADRLRASFHEDHDPLRLEAAAALEASVPEGWRLVPSIPTSAMMHAGYEAAAFPRDPEICVAMWKTMLSAAPKGGEHG